MTYRGPNFVQCDIRTLTGPMLNAAVLIARGAVFEIDNKKRRAFYCLPNGKTGALAYYQPTVDIAQALMLLGEDVCIGLDVIGTAYYMDSRGNYYEYPASNRKESLCRCFVAYKVHPSETVGIPTPLYHWINSNDPSQV